MYLVLIGGQVGVIGAVGVSTDIGKPHIESSD